MSRLARRAFLLDDGEKAGRGYAFMYGYADDRYVIRDGHEKSMREAERAAKEYKLA